uniref:Retroviral polymerase SH3-like domain-containing protein n=1 Tax=Chenopodium quinoa TaxID=63459 RepID=A0A803LMX4_CHEQI
MEISLGSKRKYGFVTGTVRRDLSDRVKQETWDTCNNTIIAWILGNVSDSIKKSVMFISNCSQIWKQLEQRYAIANGSRKYQLNKEIYETKQSRKSVTDYYTQLKILWEELESMTSLPAITTTNEEISAFITALSRHQDEHKLFQFLNGLDDDYSQQRSHLLMQTPLPSVDSSCNTLHQEENQRVILKAVKEESEPLAMFSKGSEGFPPGHPKSQRYFKGNTSRGGFIGGYRGGRNNRGGRTGRGGRTTANVQTETRSTNSSTSGLPFNAAQLEQLVKMWPSVGKSGETRVHICRNEKCRNEAKINLPTGHTSGITHKGVVSLENGLKLKDVLYVPVFKHNLMSVQKLVQNEKCKVNFHASYCSVGKKLAEMKRESCKMKVALNTSSAVTIPGTVKNVSKMSIPTLWHQRLGHAPMTKIKKIEELRGVDNKCEGICIICPAAKFTKLPYTLSNSRAKHAFELIHIDIWGSFRVPTRYSQRYFLTIVDDHSRVTWVKLLKKKSQAFNALKEFLCMGKTQLSPESKGYRLLYLAENKNFVSRDVKFYESICPYKLFCSNSKTQSEIVNNTGININNRGIEENEVETVEIDEEIEPCESEEMEQNVNQPDQTEHTLRSEAEPVRKSSRDHVSPHWHKDYVIGRTRSNCCVKSAPEKIEIAADIPLSNAFFVARALEDQHQGFVFYLANPLSLGNQRDNQWLQEAQQKLRQDPWH